MILFRRLLILLVATSTSVSAQGDAGRSGVRLALEYDAGARPGIAILPVRGANGDSVRAMLQRDLDFSDRVDIIGFDEMSLPPVSGTPNYDVFAKLRVSKIVQATLSQDGLHIILHDVQRKKSDQVMMAQVVGMPLSRDWRMSVHAASDAIQNWATGAPGIAATRIAYVRDRKIWVVDSDGAFPTVVAPEGGVSPAWHPNGRAIAYARLADIGSAIVVRDLLTTAVRQVVGGTRSGTYDAPAFSPDGRNLAYAYGIDGTDLWITDLTAPGSPRRLTIGASVNTSPTFAPGGHQIAFTSGRLSRAEVYIADADGSNAEPLIIGSFGDQSYRANPAWSPDGRLIAFASQIDGTFQLMTSSTNGKNISRVTSESANEDPAWAPDGRHLVFTSRRGGSQQLWIVDVESSRMRQLTHGTPAKSGAWSPILAGKK
jgi:TolB protein